MANWKKLAQGAAGAAGGAGLNVEEVFSTYVYDGNSSNRSITNGIDLSTEGGMVWIKGRTSTTYDFNNTLFDTERGAGYRIHTDLSTAQGYNNNSLTSFNTDGFSLGTDGSALVNWSSNDYVSWTFRKAPKFFDVVTWTGDGTAGRSISHDLGSTPGFITIKRLDGTGSWYSWHRSLNTSYGLLNQSTAFQTGGAQYVFGNNTSVVQPTSSAFTVGTSANVNSATYVAYLFAHNDGDGEFGPNGDADIIKCGSYSGTGASGNSVDLGFEPQWLMIRRTNVVGSNAFLYDTMRGMPNNYTGVGAVQELQANSSNKERDNREGPIPLSNGFGLDTTSSSVNGTSDEYIYIAIRRGPMAVPESATDVFALDTHTPDSSGTTSQLSGFVTDMVLTAQIANNSHRWILSRLAGSTAMVKTNTNGYETAVQAQAFDTMDGFLTSSFWGNTSTPMWWHWKRAPSFFDMVAYTGDGNFPRTNDIEHNLGVAPEMIWIKNRGQPDEWAVYHAGVSADPETDYLHLSSYVQAQDSAGYWYDTAPTATTFKLGNAHTVNASGEKYIAYLFASLAGVSKVGSYTGNGSTLNIDCGFSSGARFVITKRTDASSDWQVFDTERGIVAGNDSLIYLNEINSENTSNDIIDPYSSGFSLTSNPFNNISGGSYIFYAIA